jgi:MerR family copper efflux transcriptional regulator
MNGSTRRLTIGRLAAAAGVGVDPVRFYERAGLMPAAMRTASGYRTYGGDDAARLRFIRRAKALGFSLDEIAELLRLSEGKGGRAGVKALAERRLRDLESRIRELTVFRDTLARYAHACSGHGPVEGCPIIEAVLATPQAEQSSWKMHAHTPTTTTARPSRQRVSPRRRRSTA